MLGVINAEVFVACSRFEKRDLKRTTTQPEEDCRKRRRMSDKKAQKMYDAKLHSMSPHSVAEEQCTSPITSASSAPDNLNSLGVLAANDSSPSTLLPSNWALPSPELCKKSLPFPLAALSSCTSLEDTLEMLICILKLQLQQLIEFPVNISVLS